LPQKHSIRTGIAMKVQMSSNAIWAMFQ